MRLLKSASTASYGTDRGGNVSMIDIRRHNGGGHVIRYNHLVRLDYCLDTLLTIITSDCTITLEGSGLDTLRERLQRQEVVYLQEGAKGPGETILERVSLQQHPHAT